MEPLITIEITDCLPAVAQLIMILNEKQIPAQVEITPFGVDRTLAIITLHGGH